jgi:hypothetical protein
MSQPATPATEEAKDLVGGGGTHAAVKEACAAKATHSTLAQAPSREVWLSPDGRGRRSTRMRRRPSKRQVVPVKMDDHHRSNLGRALWRAAGRR